MDKQTSRPREEKKVESRLALKYQTWVKVSSTMTKQVAFYMTVKGVNI